MADQSTGRVNRFGDLIEDTPAPPAAQKVNRFGDPVEELPKTTTEQKTEQKTGGAVETQFKYLPPPGVQKILASPLFRQKSSMEKIGWLDAADPGFRKLSPKAKAEWIQSSMQTAYPYGGYSVLSNLGEGFMATATGTGRNILRGTGKLVGQDWFPETAETKAVTTPPPNLAGQLGAGAENVMEWMAPIPGVSALKLAKAPGFWNAAARFGVGAFRGGLDVGLKTLAQTGDGDAAATAAVIAGPLGALVEVGAPGELLNKWAKSQYAKVLHPLGRKAKEVAEEHIPDVMKEGYRAAAAFTKEGLAGKFNAKVAELGPKIGREYQMLDQTTRTQLAPIYDDLARWMEREVFTKGGAVKDPELGEKALEVWDYLQNAFGKNAGTAAPSEVWEIRQALDKYVYRNKLTANESVAAANQVKKAVGNIIRNQLNSQHPSIQALNNQFHLWASAAELMNRNITNELGKLQFARNTGVVGRFLMGATLGGGADVAGRRGEFNPWETGTAAALAGLAFGSTGWRTVSAVTKAKVADLLMRGQGVSAANLAARAAGVITGAITGAGSPPRATSPRMTGQTTASPETGGGRAATRTEQILDLIRKHESGGRNVPNYMFGPGYTAQGYYQITDSNWKDYAPKLGVDLKQYPHAMAAPEDVQRKVARYLLTETPKGLGNWEVAKTPQFQAAMQSVR